MKKRVLLLLTLLCYQLTAQATDLLEVFHQALCSDAKFQQAIAQRLSTKEGVPINVAALLPNIYATALPYATRSGFTGSNVAALGPGTLVPRNITTRGYNLYLYANQTIFNFAQFAAVGSAVALSKGADATLNAALQDLMIRTAVAYFAVLKDEDDVSYNEASKLAYAQQLDQVKEQYNVGLKTVTEVYTAEAQYASSVASYIAAVNKLANDRENLRVITGVYYPHLSKLSDSFPLISPQPVNVEIWVRTAQCQNWNIRTFQYSVVSALQIVRQKLAGHLPTVTFQGTFDRLYTNNIDRYNNSFEKQNGPGMEIDRTVALNINVPLFSGGSVVAQTDQACYNYRVAQEQLEQTVRDTINKTRQSYNNIVAGISKVKSDKEAIHANISAVEGMEASYKVGTTTLVDVLNQRQKLFLAQTQYAQDRYDFVNNILLLKQAAGTLGFDDLRAINVWLLDNNQKGLSSAYKKCLPRPPRMIHPQAMKTDKHAMQEMASNDKPRKKWWQLT